MAKQKKPLHWLQMTEGKRKRMDNSYDFMKTEVPQERKAAFNP